MRSVPVIIFALLVVVFAIGLAMPEAERKAPAQNQLVGTALPAIALEHINTGAAYSNNGKVMLVNVFASWCAPCELELPEFAALKQQYPALHIMGIGWHDSKTNIAQWVAKHNAPYDSIWLDPKNQAGVALGIRGVPETFIIDGHGIIRYHVPVPVLATIRDKEISPLIAELLNE